MTFQDIARFHHRFESIRPLTDGNGRVGRLLRFKQALDAGTMPFVVPDSHKHFYYGGLKNYAEEPGFLEDAFRSAQDTYFEECRDTDYEAVWDTLVVDLPTIRRYIEDILEQSD